MPNSKEVTLDELTNSVKHPTTTNEEPKVEKTPMANPNIQPGKAVSIADLGSHMKKVNHVEEKQVKQAPMVEDAFNSMTSTINGRIKRMEEEVVPIIMENARDMAMQKELGVDVEHVKLGPREESVDSIPGTTIEVKVDETTSAIPSVDIDELLKDDDNDKAVEVAPTRNVSDIQPEVKPATEAKPKASKTTNAVIEENSGDDDLDSLMKDLELEDSKLNDNDEDDETDDQRKERFKESLQSVKIARDPIDLSRFKIRKTPTSSSAVLNSIGNKNQQFKKADWALYYTKRSLTFIESRGPELEALRKTISNSNSINGVIASLRFVYEHIVDANKPPFEAWCKTIRTEDIESLYFGLYRACYADANLVARACIGENGCKKTSLIDTDIMTMIKFDNDEVKEKFYSVLNRDTTTDTTDVESELIQISDDFVISCAMPTLYSTFIQYATLKSEVIDKYSDILNTMAYIDGFYSIDRDTMELVPMSIKEYPNNLNKTVLSKLKVYTDILKTLTNDQYNVLTTKLNNIIQDSKITYIYPETTCPECGVTIPEENVGSVLNLLFTRAQLVQIKSL